LKNPVRSHASQLDDFKKAEEEMRELFEIPKTETLNDGMEKHFISMPHGLVVI
jgi:hypothetical protein